ncbi:cbb3-type cytochrome oxidase assembly protein CcoS [uncultured Tateyamaria sp.]|uniref:cbb3-type cytochrome oxidase assembly protein CcoS n=1 Tax=uncultured Tateyamaria sp. TaxID=455651 RepID=UPI002611A823|nr:cbb3-type cytochrome oxidase assembly protein CcoS [uncultured Tateyamaria sp.]
MTAIIYLIPISVGLGLCALLGFFWSVRASQYDNMESDAHRILEAEDKPMSDAQRRALNGLSGDS